MCLDVHSKNTAALWNGLHYIIWITLFALSAYRRVCLYKLEKKIVRFFFHRHNILPLTWLFSQHSKVTLLPNCLFLCVLISWANNWYVSLQSVSCFLSTYPCRSEKIFSVPLEVWHCNFTSPKLTFLSLSLNLSWDDVNICVCKYRCSDCFTSSLWELSGSSKHLEEQLKTGHLKMFIIPEQASKYIRELPETGGYLELMISSLSTNKAAICRNWYVVVDPYFYDLSCS